MQLPIYWKYNRRIKNLVPSGQLVSGLTPTFPKNAATVVLSDLKRVKPRITIYLKDSLRVVQQSWGGSYVYSNTMRIQIADGHATTASGSVDPEYLAQLNDVIQRVESVIN